MVLEVLLLAAAVLCGAGFARYYVSAVLAEDSALARASAVGVAVMFVAALVQLVRMFV